MRRTRRDRSAGSRALDSSDPRPVSPCFRREEPHEPLALLDHGGALAPCKLVERMNAQQGLISRGLEGPGGGDDAVNEDGRFDHRVLLVNRGPVTPRNDAVSVLVAEEDLGVTRGEA